MMSISRSPSRRGSVLPWFAVLLFALLPLMALVIDLGLVLLTRRQMQTAVNTAALEGLRFRDDPGLLAGNEFIEAECGPAPNSDADPSDPEWQVWLDCARRAAASRMVANVFDDDLDPENGDLRSFGAGPVVEFHGGIPLGQEEPFHAARTIRTGVPPVYKPVRNDGTFGLELNPDSGSEGNWPHGDLVAGDYDEADQEHLESSGYFRTDFDPAPPGQSSAARSFLARMRRTHGPYSVPEEDLEPGVSTTGPTLPFLFGRGGIAGGGDDPQAIWRRRERGPIVRATAIADARPAVIGRAVHVTPAVPPPPVPESPARRSAFRRCRRAGS